MNWQIRELDRKDWQGKSLVFRYTTQHYLDIIQTDEGFRLEEKALDAPVCKEFTDSLFSDWLENPVLLGVFDGE